MSHANAQRGTDWNQARDLWLEQRPPRSFSPIAKRFRVSTQRVGFVARRDNWHAIAAKLDAEAQRKTTQRIVRSHAERVSKTLGIIDGALDVYDDQLAEKAREARLRDIGELARTAQLLAGEATEIVTHVEMHETVDTLMEVALEFVPADLRPAFLERVRARLGEIGEAA